MSIQRDPAIKLFGKTIPVSDQNLSDSFQFDDYKFNRIQKVPDFEEETLRGTAEEVPEYVVNENPTSNCEEVGESKEGTLRKPDKILACPRCNSMETKFCYYNNYNVNQPRHFCKNCQRYWTDGGSMRNVPVGAGRRKNKNISPQHYVTSLKPNPVLLCESMTSVLNIADNEQVTGSIVADSNSKDKSHAAHQPAVQNFSIVSSQMPCFSGGMWAYRNWNIPPPAALCPAGYSVALYPGGPYWGCTVISPWDVPWVSHPPYPLQKHVPSGSNSPTLGRHSRSEATKEDEF